MVKQIQETPKTDGLGIAGFIVSLVGLFLPYGMASVVGTILSSVRFHKQKTGLNIAGIVLGIIGIAWKILFWVFVASSIAVL